MGLFKRIWKKITSWVREKLIAPLVDWIKTLFEDTSAWWKIWKYELSKLVSKWLENDLFFLAAVAGTIALAFWFPAIKDWVGKLSITLLLKAAWEDVKDGFKDVLDFIHIVELDAINTILKILWPDWRVMMAQLADVTSDLAQALGEGSGYIHAYFGVIHSLAIVEHSFLGTDPKLAQLSVFEDTNKALTKIDEKFREYVYSPGLIIRDIIEDFYLPRAENIRIAQQNTLDSIRTNRDKLVDANKALHGLDESLEHFMSIQPDNMKAILEERLGPFMESLDSLLETMDTKILPMIDGIYDAMALREERQQTINDNVYARIGNPYGLLAQGELLGVEERESLEEYIAELQARAEQRDEIQPLIDFLPVIEEANRALATVPVEVPAIPSLTYEAPGFPALAETAAQRARDWFVGEY
jgi:hypothetical protein